MQSLRGKCTIYQKIFKHFVYYISFNEHDAMMHEHTKYFCSGRLSFIRISINLLKIRKQLFYTRNYTRLAWKTIINEFKSISIFTSDTYRFFPIYLKVHSSFVYAPHDYILPLKKGIHLFQIDPNSINTEFTFPSVFIST